jgi:VanZ family protein
MPLSQSTITSTSRVLAIVLTVLLFVAGSFPSAGQAFPGVTHWVAHFVAFAVIAFAYALGWKKQPALLVVGYVAALGAIQECSEIFTHHHALEIADILVDFFGAGIGVVLKRAIIPAEACIRQRHA